MNVVGGSESPSNIDELNADRLSNSGAKIIVWNDYDENSVICIEKSQNWCD